MVATKAFGMGIDKPNVRLQLTWIIQGSLESLFKKLEELEETEK
jgi:superfamily II DNA helicase RecQ